MRRLVLVIGLAVTLVVPVGVLSSAPASASGIHVICKGFSSCSKHGYSSGGYSGHYKSSYWGQVKGHNCTNYVAYRLTHNSRLVAKPPGIAAAKTWKAGARSGWMSVLGKNDKPKAGDIAWWGANQGPATSTGHVAYVQSTTSSTVTVSEDNLGGAFRWVRYSGTARPKAYLRFVKSDGSPKGAKTSISLTPSKVTVSGYATDPDAYSKGLSYKVKISPDGGTPFMLGAVHVAGTSYSFYFSTSSPWFSSGGKATATLYAYNNSGTKGTARVTLGTAKYPK